MPLPTTTRAFPISVLLAAALSLAAPVRAEDMPQNERLKAVEGELKKSQAEHEEAAERAASAAHETETLKDDLVSAAGAVQESEDALSELETKRKQLDADEITKRNALDLKRQQLGGILTALVRLAYSPTEALIGQPTSPADTVRSAILLRDTVPRIESAAATLRTDLDGLAATRAQIAQQKQKIASAVAKLDGEHKRLAGLYAKQSEASREAQAQSQETAIRLAALAGEAADLRDLLGRIDADKSKHPEAEKPAPQNLDTGKPAAAPAPKPATIVTKPVPPRLFSQAQGQMPMPARGHISVRFGQNGEGGQLAKGITVETRANAQVVADYDGQVVFAGPFRGYGLLLIIEHGEGYHTLLAGMARIDCILGQHLVAGEPVGVMGNSEETPSLYIELRHQGQPINPLPWLTARKSKVDE